MICAKLIIIFRRECLVQFFQHNLMQKKFNFPLEMIYILKVRKAKNAPDKAAKLTNYNI